MTAYITPLNYMNILQRKLDLYRYPRMAPKDSQKGKHGSIYIERKKSISVFVLRFSTVLRITKPGLIRLDDIPEASEF